MMRRIHAVPRGLLVVFSVVLLTVFGLAPTASAAVLWPDEQAMITTSTYRSTYVYDVGVGNAISAEQFAQPAVTAFYRAQGGFDRNFMYWAPIVAIDRPHEGWKACTGNTGGLCQDVRDGNQLIDAEIATGQIHVKYWNGAFIGVACGNWNHGGTGPVPVISGAKYEDVNGDGVRQAGEPGLAGWTIDLSYHGTVVETATTDAAGGYSFSLDAERFPVAAGTYTLSERPQPGWVQSHAPAPVTVGYGAGAANFGGNDFGNYRPATIGGRKFDDHGADGSGTGDPGLANWTFDLDNGATAVTGSTGEFAFAGLRPGTYTVRERQQPGWRRTTPASGATTVTVTSGQVAGGVDFGNVCLGAIAVTAPAGVAVRVDEAGVPGILANDPPAPRTASGTATVSGLLPGTYRVTLTLPDGVFTTDADLTSLDGKFAIVKTITVAECGTSPVAPPFVTSQPGKITGGVRILVPGGTATAGFEFMQRGDGPRGTLEYNDHGNGIDIHTSDITGISASGGDAYVFGHAVVGGMTYGFRLHLVDAGEPGTGDRFELQVANGYSAGFGQTLNGGNVQVH
ncbi:SdrD B-like domain-containing protein [Amycolatopsis kentuckyensis]|uniref:SdrD B-like domain-containing protein n=1 Tax=Amycolatopsis kentuckyensis TaxID=218823 RepID=UPI003562A1E9